MAKALCFLDIETSGLDPNEGAVILSIGAVLEKTTAKGTKTSEFYGVIAPTPEQWKLASPDALRVNGLTWEYLQENGKPFADVRDEFVRWLFENKVQATKAVIVGQNPVFDVSFLERYMGPELRFIGVPLEDTLDVRDYYSILANRGVMPVLKKRSSENISKALGVEPEPWPHNALEGAKAVQRNYNAIHKHL